MEYKVAANTGNAIYSLQYYRNNLRHMVRFCKERNAFHVLLPDGRVDSPYKNVRGWTGIRRIASNGNLIAGVKSNGRVVCAAAAPPAGIEVNEILSWTDIKDVFIGREYAVGLKNDGTLTATCGSLNDMKVYTSMWGGLSSVTGSDYLPFAVMSNGRVVSEVSRDTYAKWLDVKMLYSCGSDGVLAISNNGSVNKCGDKISYTVESWNNLYNAAVNDKFVLGLKRDGSLICTLDQNHGIDLSAYKGCVAVASEKSYQIDNDFLSYVAALFPDGTLKIFQYRTWCNKILGAGKSHKNINTLTYKLF